MAKFYYELRKNNNSSSKSAGRYFAYAKTLETMDNRKMANPRSIRPTLSTVCLRSTATAW